MSQEELTKSNFAYTSMVAAIFSGNQGIADVILQKTDLAVNSQGVTGNSALMFAAKWGQYDLAEYLLQNAADVTLTNTDGDTALSLAMKGGHRTIVNLLRDFGAES